jgi:hypothetical protein
VISGQINPAAIPDDPAFSVLLNLLSRQDSGQDVARARAYIQYLIGLDHGECLDPATEPQLPAELLDARARVKASCPPDTRWVTDSARLLSVARDFGEANSRFVEERRSAAQGGAFRRMSLWEYNSGSGRSCVRLLPRSMLAWARAQPRG